MAISSSRMTESLHSETIISSVARNAVVYDKVIEADDVDFRVEEGGNVVVIEPGGHAQSLWRTNETACLDKEKFIVVPREVAFERIADATQEKVEQLRHVYEKMCVRARRWFYVSWIVVTLVCIGITLAGIAIAWSNLSMKVSASVPFLLIIISIASIGIVGCAFRRAQVVSKQANEYLSHFLHIENFNETIKIVAELARDDAVRGSLQEIIIAKSLGLHNGNSEKRGARWNSAVQPGK